MPSFLPKMTFSKLDMDKDLLGVGSWIDDTADKEPSTAQPGKGGGMSHGEFPFAEARRHECFFKGAESVDSGQESQRSELFESEDEPTDGITTTGIGESRVVQIKAGGRRQGNQATRCQGVSRASPAVEQQLLQQDCAHVLRDEFKTTFGKEASENHCFSARLPSARLPASCLINTPPNIPTKRCQSANTTTRATYVTISL
ncbi:hypothetical protein F5Y14DRAFT_301615 [Nemania sp. NC0429]|nr:hypothetical protein F5Y14DRAFT_301615 [Nemania sp. NC0429]